MKKPYKVILISVCVFVFLFGLFVVKYYVDGKEKINFSGKLLVNGTDANSKYNGLMLYDLQDNSLCYTGIPDGAFSNACFAGSNVEILYGGLGGTVSLFNLETKENRQIYKSNDGSDVVFAFAGSGYFSVVDNRKLILINWDNGEQVVLAEDVGNPKHSWTGDGESVYYSNVKKQICRIEKKSKQNTPLFFGTYAKISGDGKFIAVMNYLDKYALVVKDLQSGQEWRYKNNTPYEFCFSPNGKQIAMVEASETFLYLGNRIIIWDYNSDTIKLIDDTYDHNRIISWSAYH